MPIVLTQSDNPDRFTARHWMFVPIERVTEPPNPPVVPFRGLIILSGVALINFRGNSSNWVRDRVTLGINDDLARAIANAPYQPRPGFFFAFVIEQWAPFATVNARFNANVANNDGTAADAFSLDPSFGATLHVDVAVRDTDAEIFRLGYQVSLYGRLLEEQNPV